MKKKALALLMCGAMIAGTLVGCGSSEPAAESKAPASSEAKTESSAAPASSEAAEEPVEPVEVVWLGYNTSNIPMEADTFGQNLINENCPWIHVTPVTEVAADNFDAWMASGEIFDITCFCTHIGANNVPAIQKMYDDEIIREIPEEYLWEYYPTGMQNLVDYLGQEYFDNGTHLINGKCLNIPAITTQNTAKGCLMYRKDWADKLGIDAPTTLDEFHDMLYAFTYDDPDGNGVDDTYGMSGIVNYLTYCSGPFFGTYGFAVPTTYYKNDDGSVHFWGATENYKEGLRLMKEWFDEGIIDPEAMVDDRSAMRTKWAAGKLGVMGDSATWFWTNRGPSGVLGMVEDVFGEGTLAPIGPMTSEYKGETLGTGMVQMTNKYFQTFTNIGQMFTADATDEQIIAWLKMLDKFSSDIDLQVQLWYGEEGVDWDRVDGVVTMKEHVTVEYQASKGINTNYFVMASPAEFHNESAAARDIANNEVFYATPIDCAPTANNFAVASEVADQYGAEVNKVQSEFHAAVLLGNKDLDADWDAYVAQLNAAGLDKIIADYEALLAE